MKDLNAYKAVTDKNAASDELESAAQQTLHSILRAVYPGIFYFPHKRHPCHYENVLFISVLLMKNCADRKMPFISMTSALPTAIGKARRSIRSTIIWC